MVKAEEVSRNFEVELTYPKHIQACIALGKIHKKYGRVLIVGGAAIDLLTTPSSQFHLIESKKEDGRQRDLDIICEGSVDAVALITQLQVMVPGTEVDNSLNTTIHWDNGVVRLQHHSAIVEVDQAIFDPMYIHIDGLEVPVASPQTMYELLQYMHGDFIREKDKLRAEKLKAVFTKYHQKPGIDGELAKFREFQSRKQGYLITRLLLALDRRRIDAKNSPIKWIKRNIPGSQKFLHALRKSLFGLEKKLSK